MSQSVKFRVAQFSTFLGIVAVVIALQAASIAPVTQLLYWPALLGVTSLTLLASIRHLGLRATLSAHPELFRCGPAWAMTSGHVVAVLGVIQLMSVVSEPKLIGEGLATALTAYLYANVLALLLKRSVSEPN